MPSNNTPSRPYEYIIRALCCNWGACQAEQACSKESRAISCFKHDWVFQSHHTSIEFANRPFKRCKTCFHYCRAITEHSFKTHRNRFNKLHTSSDFANEGPALLSRARLSQRMSCHQRKFLYPMRLPAVGLQMRRPLLLLCKTAQTCFRVYRAIRGSSFESRSNPVGHKSIVFANGCAPSNPIIASLGG